MLEILKYPDPRLKQVSQKVSRFDDTLTKLLDRMAHTMYAARGVGLAAPQVGAPIRAFIIDIGLQETNPAKLYEFINPHLRDGKGKILFEEGCLSIPGVAETVQRHHEITVAYQDRRGKQLSLTAEELLAVAIQHENDHLDGILFIDRLRPLKRRLVKRKLSKVVTL